MLRRLLVFLCLIAVTAVGLQSVLAGDQVARSSEVTKTFTTRYLLSLPENYEQQEKWPLLLFLHGAGERGDDLEKVKQHGPPKLIAEGKQYPMIVVSPQCEADKRWESWRLLALIDQLSAELKVDQDRIYVTGLSMGGFGTWDLAAAAPDRIAAIVPICGGGETRSAKRIKDIPTWVFHGALDQAVPIGASVQMVLELRKEGGKPRFTFYQDAEHDSWTEAYATPELDEWLLSQSLKVK